MEKGNIDKKVWDALGEKIKFESSLITKFKKSEDPIVINTDSSEGYMYAPYILAQSSEESEREYDKFMDAYYKKHDVCPKCGNDSCMTSLFGYVLNMDKKEEYKDRNSCICSKCYDRHIQHDRISKEEWNSKQ